MPTRRLILAGLLSGLAVLPARAQGKKSSAAADPGTSIAGSYTTAGLNADGSKYSGTTEIVEQGDAVEFTWLVQGDTMRGKAPARAVSSPSTGAPPPPSST